MQPSHIVFSSILNCEGARRVSAGSSFRGDLPGNAQLLEEYRNGGRRRSIAGRIRREDFDEVFTELTVDASDYTRTEEDVLEDTVQINIVADIRLRVEVIGGLGPQQLELGIAASITERSQVRRRGRWGVVVRIGRQGRDRERSAEWRPMVSFVAPANRNAVGRGRREEPKRRRQIAARGCVRAAIHEYLVKEKRAVVLRGSPGKGCVGGTDLCYRDHGSR